MTIQNAVLIGTLLSFVVPGGARAQAPDLQAEASRIVQADAAFAKSVADKDRQAFLTFLSGVTTFNGGSPNEVHGRDAVMKQWSVFFEPDGPALTWVPIKGEVIGAGDLGYTVGRSVSRRKAADGTITERHGQYLTVWTKEDDGSWKVIFDTGSTLPQ